MASSMVLSFLGSVEVVVVKEGDWEELSEKVSTRSPHRDPSHDLGHTMITQNDKPMFCSDSAFGLFFVN